MRVCLFVTAYCFRVVHYKEYYVFKHMFKIFIDVNKKLQKMLKFY